MHALPFIRMHFVYFPVVSQNPPSTPTPLVKTFLEYWKKKAEERQHFSCGKMGTKNKEKRKVQVTVNFVPKISTL